MFLVCLNYKKIGIYILLLTNIKLYIKFRYCFFILNILIRVVLILNFKACKTGKLKWM